jgi:competence protein ComEA
MFRKTSSASGYLTALVFMLSLFSGLLQAAEPAAAAGQINLNQADVATLSELHGIGKAKAEAIIAYREEHGPFEAIEELDAVNGIGAKTIENNADRIAVK